MVFFRLIHFFKFHDRLGHYQYRKLLSCCCFNDLYFYSISCLTEILTDELDVLIAYELVNSHFLNTTDFNYKYSQQIYLPALILRKKLYELGFENESSELLLILKNHMNKVIENFITQHPSIAANLNQKEICNQAIFNGIYFENEKDFIPLKKKKLVIKTLHQLNNILKLELISVEKYESMKQKLHQTTS